MGIKILIIDPSIILGVSALPDLLEGTDRKVLVAKNEVTAKAQVKKHKIDIIFLEPLMPSTCLRDFSKKRMKSIENIEIGGVGLALLKTLKKEPNAILSKVILYTMVSRENCLKVGFSEKICHHQKP